ncbi:Maltose/maltodextrin import ATP-binding protein MalK [Hartmannibacter diazotrophicus]|uniref:Maltose/maltodextrin import ATP-binding protein MalK n=1 Tax=Hartmannibacter diazotrophicus TaxID=1482074 RepID=A0A2C9D9G8_9HYPH|nr:ABC transporter ATP-binding protein [Hartmannibacter diazotrophicus]SON56788.1 Maltose/maltodextrin import ATP-binding protein MalK [Hartmannibacter diazotrophicus]
MADIVIKSVAKRFGSHTALHDIDLTIKDQEFMVLLGASGCGKTTLLRIIAGLETLSSGEVSIGGRRVDHLPPRERGIAMVFQNYAVFPHMTVFENIAFGLRMKKVSEADIKDKVTRAATLMHIDPYLERYSAQLSGGQRQRVAVARALAVEPSVLLMDEPLSNLDALLRLEMRAELKGILAESKTTTIYVTHDQVEAMSLADRISVMNGGRIVQAAPATTVYANPADRFVGGFIGNPPMNFLPAKRSGNEAEVAGYRLAAPAGGGSLELGIRPEDMDIAEDGLHGKVRVVEPLGPHKLVSVDVDGHLLRAVLPNEADVKSGAAVALAPRPGTVRWFEAESGKAVATSGVAA